MAFFLIGRASDDEVRLLSPTLFLTRQDAMAELSHLSADPSFDQWDAEVSVVNLDSGVPILLVRPAAATVAVPETIIDTSDADAWVADLPADALVELLPSQVPVEVFAIAEEALEPTVWPPATMVPLEPVGDPAIADAIAEEAQAAEEPAVEQPSEPIDEPSPSENNELRAAIQRTTEHMTAEGIVAPESIGPAQEEFQATPADALLARQESAPEAEAENGPEPEAPGAVEEPAPIFWPWDTAEPDVEAEVAPEVASVYDALEQPGEELPEPDVEAVLRRPVMMGSYDEETDASTGPASADMGAQTPMSQMAEQALSSEAEASEGVEATSGESDFILDLDALQAVAPEAADAESQTDEPARSAESPSEASDEPQAIESADGALDDDANQPVGSLGDAPSTPASPPLADYTCEDCVYVATCPNRDQRQPKDCGSFQWK